MSSFFKQKSKSPNNKISDIQPTFQNALNQIDDNEEYDFAPSIQQYNFTSYDDKKDPQQKRTNSKQITNKQSEIQPRVSFNMQQRQTQIIEKLNKKVNQLEIENNKLKKDNYQLQQKISLLEQQIQQLNKKLFTRETQQNRRSKVENKNDQYQLFSNQQLSSNNKKSLSKKLSKQNSLVMNIINNNQPLSTSQSSSTIRQKTILSTSPILLKELLLECNQSSQFQQTKRSIKTKSSNYKITNNHVKYSNKERDDQFYQYKDTKDCFNPFYNNLSRQLQLRCKKAMLRQKELIYRDDFVQMGCISKKIDVYQFCISLIITNLHNQPIKNVNIAYLYKNDIEVVKQVKSVNLNVLKSTKDHTIYHELNTAQQIKQSIQVLVQTVDFRCILVSLQFENHRGQQHKIVQILPGCKHRLFTYLVPTPIPTNFTSIQKVIIFDKKFLSDLDKLKSYYKNIHFTTDRHKNPQALMKIQFLLKLFFITFKMIGNDKLAIGVYYLPEDAQISEKVLNQLQFIFER